MENQTNQISWYELIRRERDLRSWTQEEVAGKIGVEPRTVRAWESGATFPSAKHRRKLAALYKKQLDELQLVKDIDKNEVVRQQPAGLATCNPTSNGIVAYIDRNYQAGCLSITANIPDLTPLNFDHVISSIRFVGSYVNTEQLVIYQQPNYRGMCGMYSQD